MSWEANLKSLNQLHKIYVMYINRSRSFFEFWGCHGLWGLLNDFLMYQNVVEYIKIYGKSPFSIKFQKKKSPWVGLELTKRNKKIDEKIWKIWRVKFCRLSSKSQPNLDSLIKSVYITEFSYRSRHIRQKDPLITYRGRTGKRSSSRT